MVWVRDIAREAVAHLGLESGYELAGQFVSQAYQELCGKAQFRHLRKLGALYLPAPLNTGTFTVTLGSPIVVADSAATAALSAFAPDYFQNQWFRIQQGSVWYKILRVDPTNAASWRLILETPYASDNNAQGIFSQGSISGPVNYYIIPRFIDLDPSARQVGIVVCDAVYRPLRRVSEDELNILWSSRNLVAFPPWAYALFGTNDDADGLPKQIEIFPWPVNSTTLHYTYWTHPPQLSLDDPVPPNIDPDILREGAKVYLMSNQAGKSARTGNIEAAAYWRNEYRMQSGVFDRLTSRAVRNDRGGDDVKFLLSSSVWNRGRPLDWDPIQDAYQNFLSRGL